MTLHVQSLHLAALHHPGELVMEATGLVTALLAAAAIVALGASGVEAAVVAIAVLTPLAVLGAVALSR